MPNRLSQALERLRAQNIAILDLTGSNPTRCGLDYNGSQILAALADPAALEYRPEPKGLRGARESVAAYYRESYPNQASVDPESVVLTASTSEAYSFIFRLLCDPGDEVLIPAPSYPLFELLADLLDLKIKPYSLLYDHGWQIDFHSLEAAMTSRSRAVILVHPNNPTGSYIKPAEAARLNELCQHGLALVADEVFLDYAHERQQRESFAYNQRALTFTLSGLSKISALPQLKVAWIVSSGPQKLAQEALARLEFIADTYLSVNTPVQLALPKLLEQRHSVGRQLLGRIQKNLTELDSQLARQISCCRLQVEGGWYVVLRVLATGTDEDLAIELLEKQHVLAHPGHFYNFPGEGYFVLSLITPVEVFSKGIRRLLKLFV